MCWFFVFLQENSWNIEYVILKWEAEVWSKYSFFNLKWKTLPVLDNINTHKTRKVKANIKECRTALSLIPSGLAWILQPLGISINKVLKKFTKQVFSLLNWQNNINVSKCTII